MNKRNKAPAATPYAWSDHHHVTTEREHGKETIVAGDLIRIKTLTGLFKVVKFVHNSNTDERWVDVMRPLTGERRSFNVEKIKGKHKVRKKRVPKA